MILGLTLGRLGPSLAAPSLGEPPLLPQTPSGWWSVVWACLFMPPVPHSDLCVGLRSHCLRPPWAGFVTFLGLVPSPGNWNKATALQGRPKDHVRGGAAPGPALTEWGGGQGHTVSADSAGCWGSHACYIGKVKQKTCRAWPQPTETQRASCELQRSLRPSMRRNLERQLASPPSHGGEAATEL